MDTFLTDLRYALHALVRSPGFTGFAASALALGIAANVVMYSVARRVLFDPVPFAAPHRVMTLWEDHRARSGSAFERVSPANFAEWRAGAAGFAKLAAVAPWTPTYEGGGASVELAGLRATADIFGVTGIEPNRGRGFRPEDTAPGAEPVVVVAEALWRDHLGAPESLAGVTITLDGERHAVIGVHPADAEFVRLDPDVPARPSVWGALDASDTCRTCRTTFAVGRLETGITRDQAGSELAAVARGLAETHPESNRNVGVTVSPLGEYLVGPIRPAITTLMVAVGFVLLVTCANVANLILARSATRRGEIALRAALGADRRRLVGQLLTESMVLAFVGAGIGVLVAAWGLDLLVSIIPQSIAVPRLAGIDLHPSALAVTGGLAVLTGVLVGVLPSVHGSATDPAGPLAGIDRRSVAPIGGSRSRSLLVVVEVTVSLVLLIGAGILLASYARLTRNDPGFATDGLVAVELAQPVAIGPATAASFQETRDAIATVPGVEGVAFVSRLPFALGRAERTAPVRSVGGTDGITAVIRPVSAGYAATLGVPVLAGRDLEDRDVVEPTRGVLVNETLVRLIVGERAAIDTRLVVGADSVTIAGVVGDTEAPSGREVRPIVYVPVGQFAGELRAVIYRAAIEPGDLLAPIREVLVDRLAASPAAAATVAELRTAAAAPQRLTTIILAVFAGMSLALASIGLYGALSYTLTQRARDIALRMALGANPAWLKAAFIGRALGLVAIGTAIGTGVSFGSMTMISDNVFGIVMEPAVFAGGAAVMFATAAAASYFPAHRAARANPMSVLRNR